MFQQQVPLVGRDDLDPAGFAGATYQEQAALAREALALLQDGRSVRRSMLEEGAAFYDFLAERMPALLAEWHARRDNLTQGRRSRPPANRKA